MVFNNPDNYCWGLFFFQMKDFRTIGEIIIIHIAFKIMEKYSQKVKFKILKLEDFASSGSEVCIGALLEGNHYNGKIYYTDCTDTHWIFYVGDTCEILNQ